MSQADKHVRTAIERYNRYRKKQDQLEVDEDEFLRVAKGNRQIASLNAKQNKEFMLDASARSGHQEYARTEALMAIMELLYEIRNMLRREENSGKD